MLPLAIKEKTPTGADNAPRPQNMHPVVKACIFPEMDIGCLHACSKCCATMKRSPFRCLDFAQSRTGGIHMLISILTKCRMGVNTSSI